LEKSILFSSFFPSLLLLCLFFNSILSFETKKNWTSKIGSVTAISKQLRVDVYVDASGFNRVLFVLMDRGQIELIFFCMND